MNRREFLHQTILAGAATSVGLSMTDSRGAASVQWPIGCFNRPWTTWSFDETLKQIKAAGYPTVGLLTRTKEEPFIGADGTPDYLSRLKQRIADSGLKATMAALRSRHNIPLDESIKSGGAELLTLLKAVKDPKAAQALKPPGAEQTKSATEAIRQRESQASTIKERLGAILSPETLPPDTVSCPAK